MELGRILVRRKAWIVATVAACLVLAALYLFTAPADFEAKVGVRIGQVAGEGPLEAADVLALRLMAQYGEVVAVGTHRPRPYLKRASASKGAPSLLDLVVLANTPSDAAGFLHRIVASVQQEHNRIYNRDRSYLIEYLEQIEAQRVALTQQLEASSSLLKRLAESDPIQASLLAQDQGRITVALAALEAERPKTALRLSASMTYPTQVIGEVVAPSDSSRPVTTLILAFSLALGLLAGTVFAYLAEFALLTNQKASRR